MAGCTHGGLLGYRAGWPPLRFSKGEEHAGMHNAKEEVPLTALRVVLIVALIAVLSLSGSAVAQTGLGGIGPPKGAVIGAAVGVGAVLTGLVLYLTLHKTYITGCTQSANGASSLTDDRDRRSYILVDESSQFKAGEQVKLQGKKKKDKQGKRSFQVTKIKQDYGPCQQ